MNAIQTELLELVRLFDHICREENIEYWIDFGTLLGAVRHGGFIPWDDDIDLSMTYENYRRFFEVCDRYFPPHIRAVNYERSEDCITPFHGYLQNTDIQLTDVVGDTILLFGDLFFYTDVPGNKLLRRGEQLRLVWKSLKVHGHPLSADKGSAPVRLAKKLVNAMTIRPDNAAYKRKTLERLRKKLDARHTGASGLISAGYSAPGDYSQSTVPATSVFPLGEVEFEGLKLMAPGDTHTYLTCLYGDYMTPPPADEQKGKHVAEGQD